MDVWTIRPLVWVYLENFEGLPKYEAYTLFGTLVAREVPSGGFVATALSHMSLLDDWAHKSIESAKQHCEQWYESRMKAGLVAVDVETLRKECGT
jgi:hypothetical protein